MGAAQPLAAAGPELLPLPPAASAAAAVTTATELEEVAGEKGEACMSQAAKPRAAGLERGGSMVSDLRANAALGAPSQALSPLHSTCTGEGWGEGGTAKVQAQRMHACAQADLVTHTRSSARKHVCSCTGGMPPICRPPQA